MCYVNFVFGTFAPIHVFLLPACGAWECLYKHISSTSLWGRGVPVQAPVFSSLWGLMVHVQAK